MHCIGESNNIDSLLWLSLTQYEEMAQLTYMRIMLITGINTPNWKESLHQ